MSNKKLPENATKTEGAELARRGRGEISDRNGGAPREL